MTLGVADRQGDLLDDLTRFCGEAVGESSIYELLHRERDRLFPDEAFADLYTDRGRRSVPPSVLACVMVLQRLEGCSDREAADRFTFDARWRYAAGVGDWDSGPTSFVHTVLVRTRMRLRDSADPDRIFRVSKDVAADAGLVGARRALDSAPLHDAVATQDTVTLIRSGIRGLLRAADAELEAEVRAVLGRDDDYAAAGKPACDWDDDEAREALVDALVADALAALRVCEDRDLTGAVSQAAELLATVAGQDVEEGEDGRFRIARRVAPDRVISTVDPEARHGHKSTSARHDGYKGHVAVDVDSEIVTAAEAGPANAGDADMTKTLLSEPSEGGDAPAGDEPAAGPDHGGGGGDDDDDAAADPADDSADTADDPAAAAAEDTHADADHDTADDAHDTADDAHAGEGEPRAADDADDTAAAGDEAAGRVVVYGDAAYGSGDNLEALEGLDATAMVKVPLPVAPGGRYAKDAFTVDVDAGQVTCPAGHTAAIAFRDDGSGQASFGGLCDACPLRERCTTSKAGRTISISRHEQRLAAARARQQDPAWQADYRANRPKVERKLAHLTRRGHGGRRARVRGRARVDQDWKLLAGAVNLARLAALGLRHTPRGWQTATT